MAAMDYYVVIGALEIAFFVSLFSQWPNAAARTGYRSFWQGSTFNSNK